MLQGAREAVLEAAPPVFWRYEYRDCMAPCARVPGSPPVVLTVMP